MPKLQAPLKIDDRGRITIPKALRETLGVDGREAVVQVTIEPLDETDDDGDE
ncbi:MraZ N-terminal domain-containing protein [Haladaptatus halobius]|uniref:MraZ N-terminal domain-containing protein n=1 Tax=Haladaptatus halobius TaxID=2884875 RepID=UPI001D0A2034|nr:MraZ N-terminal domain-containing protein [Haladaptatus halobius]